MLLEIGTNFNQSKQNRRWNEWKLKLNKTNKRHSGVAITSGVEIYRQLYLRNARVNEIMDWSGSGRNYSDIQNAGRYLHMCSRGFTESGRQGSLPHVKRTAFVAWAQLVHIFLCLLSRALNSYLLPIQTLNVHISRCNRREPCRTL